MSYNPPKQFAQRPKMEEALATIPQIRGAAYMARLTPTPPSGPGLQSDLTPCPKDFWTREAQMVP
eukprot:c27142_g1_i1 orf=1-192(-)